MKIGCRFLRFSLVVCLMISGTVFTVRGAEDRTRFTLLSTTVDGVGPVGHGLKKLELELSAKQMSVKRGRDGSSVKGDFYIIAGLATDNGLVTDLLKDLNQPLPQGKESLVVRKTTFQNKPAVLLCGADDVGLMYAALDTTKRISWSKNPDDPFEYIRDTEEKADVKERAVSTGTFHRRYFEERLHDTDYWETYFDSMAEHRLNQFLLIFGYKNNQYREPNFTAPAYPNFFNLEEFPYVKQVGITPEQQEKNTAALKKIIALAHARGIEFGVGLWDQIERDKRYLSIMKDDIEAPADTPKHLIWGLSEKNLIPYTKVAIRKFFRTFQDIDLVQFRMHWESGITGDVALKFWKEIFGILKEECPDIKIEARAKDVPDETLYDGADTGMDFRVATKHWMEQMGQPFHPTHINKDNQHDRRHGYADLLRYPQRYGFKWRVWSGGTTRVFLWGDPHWVKLFAEGSHLYDGVGFEFNEPLYFKMNGSKHDAKVSEILHPDYRYYTYEFERYWHYYQLLGRIAYNPDTPSEIWEMEFRNRFGNEAGTWLREGLHQASKILPRIVSASYLYSRFPSPQGWPELQRLGDLKHFARTSKPSDIQQFASPMEEAERILSGEYSVRRQPCQTSEWFHNCSKSVLTSVEQAEKSIGKNRTKEFISTITDLKMLAYLAQYHSQRLKAAVSYNLYEKTGDLVSFDKAIEFETKAVRAYGSLVAAAGNVYSMRLDFGSNEELFPGHWNKEHQRLQKELAELRSDRNAAQSSEKDKSLLAHIPIQRARLNEPIMIAATVRRGKSTKDARVMFVTEGNSFKSADMRFAEDGICSSTIPNPGKEGNLRYYLEIIDESGNKHYFPEKGAMAPCVVILSNDRDPPAVEVERVTTGKLNKALKISAQVTDLSGVQFVSLRYRRVSQFEDYQSVQMVHNAASGKYEAVIPADFFDGKYDVMYFIEAMDTKGNGRMYPDMEVKTPYVIVHLDRQNL